MLVYKICGFILMLGFIGSDDSIEFGGGSGGMLRCEGGWGRGIVGCYF